jgi:hypothetical protein
MHACMLVRHLYLSVLQDARARASRRRCPESGARCRAGFRLHDCDCASRARWVGWVCVYSPSLFDGSNRNLPWTRQA